MTSHTVGIDRSTELSEERTSLALERNYLAADRTLMGWIRTSLSMISFGFTIGKIGQALENKELHGLLGRTWTVAGVAYCLVLMGIVALVGAALQYRFRVHRLYALGLPHQLNISMLVAVLLVLLGIGVFTMLVLRI